MASRISVTCPGCMAKVNLPDESRLGKKVKCPKCADIFVAQAEDDDDDLDEEDEEERPAKGAGKRSRGGAAAGGKKPVKKGAKAGGGIAVGPAIAGVAAAIVSFLAIGYVMSGGGGGNAPKPLAAPAASMDMASGTAPMAGHAATPMAGHAGPSTAHAPDQTATAANSSIAAAPAAQSGFGPPKSASVAVASPATPTAPTAPVASAKPTPDAILGLRWMPANTEMLIHVKLAALWQAPLLKGLVENPAMEEQIRMMQSKSGLVPADIESITFGIGELSRLKAMNPRTRPPKGELPPQPKAMAVFRSKKPLSLDDIIKSAPQLKAAEYNSKAYFEAAADGPRLESFAGWLAEPTTLIMGQIDDLKVCMDRQEPVTPRPEMLMMDPSFHVMILAAPLDPNSLREGMPPTPPPPPGTPPEIEEMTRALVQSSKAFGLGFNIRGGFDIQTSVMLADADAATKVKSGIDSSVAKWGAQAGQAMLVGKLAGQLVSNLKVDLQNQIVRVSTGLPDSEQKEIEALVGLATMFGNPLAKFMPKDDKLPGETPPVEAEIAKGVPEGVTLEASAGWSKNQNFDSQSKVPFPLQVVLLLKGEPVSAICGYGQVEVKSLTMASGSRLKPYWSALSGSPDISKSMTAVTGDKPDELRIALMLAPYPAEADREIDSLEGTFKIVTSSDPEEFTIEDAPKRAKRPLTDPALKASGVKLILSKDPLFGEQLMLSCAKTAFIGKASLILPDGTTMEFNSGVDKNQPVKIVATPPFGGSKSFPEGTKVEFTLYKSAKEQAVTYKFNKVPLPPVAARPVERTFQGINPGSPNGAAPFGNPPPGNSVAPNGFPANPATTATPATTPAQPVPGQPNP